MSMFGSKGIFFLAVCFRFIGYFFHDPCMNPVIALAYYSYNYGPLGMFSLDPALLKYIFMVWVVGPTLGACSVSLMVSHVSTVRTAAVADADAAETKEKVE